MSPRVLLRRLLGATSADESVAVLPDPARARQTVLAGLAHQVTAFADEGASASEIARRTGLAHDAIALILHFRQPAVAESNAGPRRIRRNESASWGWVADA